MVRWRRTTPCERAAQWISLEFDGEIAVLERAALARHVQHCERCRTARAELAAITFRLREAPQEGPSVRVEIAVPQRRRRVVVRAGVAAVFAAAAAAAAVVSFPTGSTSSQAGLGFLSIAQQREFALEHVSTEPTLYVALPPGSFALRALR